MSLPFADDVALLASLDLLQSMGWFATELSLTGGVVRVLFLREGKIKREMEMWFSEVLAFVVPICIINAPLWSRTLGSSQKEEIVAASRQNESPLSGGWAQTLK